MNYIIKKINDFFKITILTTSYFCLATNSGEENFFLKIGDWQKAIKVNSKSLQLESIEQSIKKREVIQDLDLYTDSGVKVPIRFYDRNSDAIIILGQALPACKETMSIYAEIFSSYDILLFDYRWNNKYLTSLLKSIGRPTKKILLDEAEEVRTVIKFASNYKQYKKRIGLGECYSNFLFAQVQAEDTDKYGGPFTHLIFDSCWYSLQLFLDSICTDPFLPISPKKGGAPWGLKKITNNRLFKFLLFSFVFTIMDNISIEKYISLLTIPVMFIHGLNDLFVPQNHFEKIWQAMPSKFRAVLFTPYCHCDNLHNKLVYKSIVELFLSCSMKDFQGKFDLLLSK